MKYIYSILYICLNIVQTKEKKFKKIKLCSLLCLFTISPIFNLHSKLENTSKKNQYQLSITPRTRQDWIQDNLETPIYEKGIFFDSQDVEEDESVANVLDYHQREEFVKPPGKFSLDLVRKFCKNLNRNSNFSTLKVEELIIILGLSITCIISKYQLMIVQYQRSLTSLT